MQQSRSARQRSKHGVQRIGGHVGEVRVAVEARDEQVQVRRRFGPLASRHQDGRNISVLSKLLRRRRGC